MNIFVHNSFGHGDIVLTRAIINTIKEKFTNSNIIAECRYPYILEDLNIKVIQSTVIHYGHDDKPTPNCPPDFIFHNAWFGVHKDLFYKYGLTYYVQIESFNRTLSRYNIPDRLPHGPGPKTKFFYPESNLTLPNNSCLIENGPATSGQSNIDTNTIIGQLADEFPNVTFYCSHTPAVERKNIIDCHSKNLIELSQLGNKCKFLILRGSAVGVACMTEINKNKPRILCGWCWGTPVWEGFMDGITMANSYIEISHAVRNIINNPI